MITTQQIIRTSHPLNSEPKLSDLVKDFITTDLNFFNRNHGDFTVLTDAALVTISVDPIARLARPTLFNANDNANDKIHETRTISQLKSMTPTTVNAALMCAGNRRSEMNDIQAVEGVLWDRGVIGSAIWTGLKLRELLVLFINLLPSNETLNEDDDGDAKGKGRYDGLHVHFEADQTCEEETERKDYSASIPLAYAMNDQVPILLAYSMNSEPLSIEHGGPLRVVIPGIIGARWTKWVARIVIRAEESKSYYQRQDYRLLPPIADASTKGYWMARMQSMQEYSINCVICSPAPDEILSRDSSIVIRGYSIAPHGLQIRSVLASISVANDREKPLSALAARARALSSDQWIEAKLIQAPVVRNELTWSWTLWEVPLPNFEKRESIEVVAKCQDSNGNWQPQSTSWNLRGLAENSWSVTRFRVE